MSRWDWDGFEFDYGRNACVFKSVFEGGSATDEDREILTAFHRQIRKMTDAHAAETGKPFPLAVVVPETPALAERVGIDLEQWLKEGLVDVIIAGNGYVPFSPRALDMVALGRRYDVPVYIRINANTGGATRPWHHHIEAWRGYANNVWTSGASGVYVFNTYDQERFSDKALDICNEIGDPQSLAGRDRMYLVDWDFARWGYGGADVAFYMPRENLLPMPLAQEGACVAFNCLEDLSALDPPPKVSLELVVKDWADGDACAFVFNGKPLADPSLRTLETGERVSEYALEPDQVARGVNRVEARYRSGQGSDEAATLVGVTLRVGS